MMMVLMKTVDGDDGGSQGGEDNAAGRAGPKDT